MAECQSMITTGVLAVALVLCVPGKAQPPVVSDLPKSSACSTRATLVYPGGPAMQTTMRVSSGGGWCWFDVSATMNSIRIVATYTVTRAPAHGEVTMGEVNQKTRIAYRPVAGFVGDDNFVVVNKMTNSERSVAVTIVR
jgi:hypothetical protein